MSFGDHLEELRSRLVRALLGVIAATAVTLLAGQSILEWLYRPLLVVQQANGLQPQLQALSPTAAFTTYMKIAFLSGLIIAMPWVLHQAWMFVVSGLYRHEKRFIVKLVPASSGLFLGGVLFLYFLVLPAVLQFFIGFNKTFAAENLTPYAFQSLFLPDPSPLGDVGIGGETPTIPLLREDPPDVKTGAVWINTVKNRLMIKSANGHFSLPYDRGAAAPIMQSQFAVDSYVSFVLVLALAFGIAFETPIVVFFLAWTGLVTTTTMMRGRRFVILGIVVVAAIMTPPDVVSLLLLAAPMYGLFEAGLLVARWGERRKNLQQPA
jgi:sec-independent protein translocase protein TatC